MNTEHCGHLSADEFRSIIDTSLDGFLMVDMTGHILETNDSYCQLVGYTRDQLLNMHISEINAIDSAEVVSKRLEEIIKRGFIRFNTSHRHKNGSIIDVEISGNYIPLHGGSFVSFIRDVSHQKQAAKALQLSEEKYRLLFENAGDSISVIDMQAKVLAANPLACKMLGYTYDELVTLNVNEIDTRPQLLPELIGIVLKNGHNTFDTEHFRKDGSIIAVSVDSRLITWDGQPAILNICRDISERKRVEQELLESNRLLNEAREQAEAGSIAKSRFLATMSHEIRTPMNGVIGMIELLQHTQLTPEQREYAEGAKNSGIEMVHLLNDILDLSKIEADKIELGSSDFNLQPVISDTINLLSLSAREKAVKLVSSTDTDVPMSLKGDTGRLRQIITNLISNAIKFTHKGTVSLQVHRETEDEHSVTLRFLIKDTGIGIATNKLKHIFDPFTQADNSTTRKYGGTGLGLTICKRLSELMGGSIGVESTEGEGSTFWFTVVLDKQNKEKSDKKAIPVSNKQLVLHLPNTSATSNVRILLAEDDPRAQKIVSRLLKNYGYLVDVASDGNEALQALENNDYELVLMDCMMPNMSGYEVTAVIRNPDSSVRRHDIPIIALTGNAMKQDRDLCTAAGMDDHLPKPLILDDLLSKLDTWLKR